MSLLSLILTLMAGVGFTEAVCGTPATMSHGVPDSWESVSNMFIVIRGYSYDMTNFKLLAATGFHGNTDPIMTVGISLEMMPHSPFKKSTSIALALSPEPLVHYNWWKQFSRVVYAPQHP